MSDSYRNVLQKITFDVHERKYDNFHVIDSKNLLQQHSKEKKTKKLETHKKLWDLVKMKESDLKSIYKLELQIFPNETPSNKEMLRYICNKGLSFVIKSSITNQPIGYVFVGPIEDKLWIEDFGVSPDYTRNGIGTKLLNQVIKFADKNNKTIGLQVRVNNKNVISLYNKLGFKNTGQDNAWMQMSRALFDSPRNELLQPYNLSQL